MGKQLGGPMEEREGELRWDGLCSRDAAARAAALDTIGQAVLRRAESIAPAAADGLLVPAARDGLSAVLARLLMLSRRCPFPDVREKSEAILSEVQVSLAAAAVKRVWESPAATFGTFPGPAARGAPWTLSCAASGEGIWPWQVRAVRAAAHARAPLRAFGEALLKGRGKAPSFGVQSGQRIRR